jgi:hypothetical protein
MDGVRIGYFRSGDQSGDVEVALLARGRTDADSFIGKSDVQGVAVGFRIDSDSFDPKLATRTNNPEGYLATICNEYLVEQISPSYESVVARQGVDTNDCRRGAEARSPFLDHKQSLVVFDWLPILGKNLGNPAVDVGFDLIHQLHRLDDAKNRSDADFLPDLDIRLGVRGRSPIERSDDRRPNFVQLTFYLRGRLDCRDNGN